MVITYYGVSCFKAQSGETTLAFDPPAKEFPSRDFGLKPPRFQADIVLISHGRHKDHAGRDTLPGKGENKKPFVIDGPGEYEVKGVRIAGVKSFHDEKEGEELGGNTIYILEFEGVKICHMGDFGEEKLKPETKEAIDGVDILFVPIAGPANNPQKAAKIAAQLGAKIVIPAHYHEDAKALKKFLDEAGGCDVKPTDKLTIKKKDLAEKKSEVVVLNPVV